MKSDWDARWPRLLLLIYLLEFAALAIQPYNRVIWLTENSIALLTVGTLVALYWRGVRFSKTAYTLAALFLYLHTIGGHYTFERVPFDRVTELFGFSRNHFDRVCHFLVGGFGYMALEFIEKRRLVRGRFFAAFLVVMAVFGFAAIFELVEWIYAELADPAAGSAFLGSQGDIWDAQKDMLCDGLGAIAATFLYAVVNPKTSSETGKI